MFWKAGIDMQELMEKNLHHINPGTIVGGSSVVGKIVRNGGKVLLKADGGKLFSIDEALPIHCKEGDLVSAVVGADTATVTAVFGSAAEQEPNYKALLCDNGLDAEFEPDALVQAKQAAFTEISALMAKRTDLRGKTVITISESENSRTECGFSVETGKDGCFVLGIHTADVVEFVPSDSALERAVYSRGKTAVLPDREIPMLPDAITKGPCFLEVGADRLAVSYFLTIDGNGVVKDFSFCESIINTASNCLFSEIDALFLDYDASAIMHLRKAYASIHGTLENMFTLGAVLQSARAANGGADIDKAERHFIYGIHGGRPIGMEFRKDSDPKRLVREFLSIAGQELAMYLHTHKLPSVYRVQPKPSKATLCAFRDACTALGIDTADYDDTALVSEVINAARGARTEELLLTVLRSLLPESGFDSEPQEHFLYNTKMYARFAYPLNRCADFCNQQIVKAVLAGKTDEENLLKLKEKVAACILSDGESRVNRAESLIETLVALDCLRRDKNKRYSGLIRSVDAEKVTILLDNGCTATVCADQVASVSDGVAVINGASYGFGDEINVDYASVDFENGILYVTAR